jgi:hypothetical protein
VLEVMTAAVEPDPPQRVVLVAHQDCHARLAFERGSGKGIPRLIEVRNRRRRSVELVEAALGVWADTWYLTKSGARRVAGAHRHPSSDGNWIRAGSAADR